MKIQEQELRECITKMMEGELLPDPKGYLVIPKFEIMPLVESIINVLRDDFKVNIENRGEVSDTKRESTGYPNKDK